ncbi:MAG: CbiQ family ECF transporter T component [Candidatus Brocadiaceae bacterium]
MDKKYLYFPVVPVYFFCFPPFNKNPFCAYYPKYVPARLTGCAHSDYSGLHEGESAWVSFSIMGYTVILKEEGLRSGLHICCKVLGGVSLVILLSFTTTISQLCTGLKWFPAPDTLLELLVFISRYIFLLLEEVATMDCSKNRLGYASWKKTVMSFGALGGMLIIRAFERAERTSEAMRQGYRGNSIFMINLPRWKKERISFHPRNAFVVSILIYTGNW